MARILLILLLGLNFTHCTQKETVRVVSVPTDDGDSENSPSSGPDRNKVRAEKQVVSAEELMTPIGFMLADQILDMAIKNDPDNRKAQFYKLAIAPSMKFRGLLNRLAPLRPNFVSLFEKLSIASGALGDFLRDRNGGRPFSNEEDLQKFLAEVQVEQKKLAEFISRNKTFITRLAVAHVHDFDRLIRECSVHRISANSYRLTPCAHMQVLQLRVNRGDWETMFQAANGARMAAATVLSYNLEGALNFHLKQKQFKTEKAKTEHLMELPRFGKILTNHQMDLVKERAIDTYTGVKWMLSLQPQLCAEDSPRNEHLFQRICLQKTLPIGPVEVSSAQAIDLLRMSIGGNGGKVRPIKPREGFSGREVTEINMDMLALYKFPLDDLKALAPKTFDACGNSTSLNDPTFGGTFPSGNADDLLLRRSFCELEPGGRPR